MAVGIDGRDPSKRLQKFLGWRLDWVQGQTLLVCCVGRQFFKNAVRWFGICSDLPDVNPFPWRRASISFTLVARRVLALICLYSSNEASRVYHP